MEVLHCDKVVSFSVVSALKGVITANGQMNNSGNLAQRYGSWENRIKKSGMESF